MGRQIIKQPNGKYCIFSSVVDSVISYDMEEQDIINEWAEESKIKIEKEVKKIISELNNGGKPYYQFTLTYEKMLKLIGEIYGSEEADNIKNLIK